MIRVLAALMLLLVAACSAVQEQPTDIAPQPEPSVEPKVAEPAVKKAPPASWVQFGMVLSARSVQVLPIEGEPNPEPGMDMTVLLDSGESLQVIQPLSQAGKLTTGDRVRVLRIGGFTRVTFWPYGNLSPGSP